MTTTARLHISGLTPAITQSDLEQRFSTFGSVKDVDGVGKLDGLGQPRRFAYVTLESTKDKLARCMNLLSGSTWKGAKLRVGAAKPDFRARRELELHPPPRPKLDLLALRRARVKRRLKARRLLRGTQGKEAKDMSLVTLENVHSRKGWRRTPLDHLIRPLRMRPIHPIPLPPKSRSTKIKPKKLNSKRRKFELGRARCTVIDPARYGAVHLSVGRGGLGEELLGGGIIQVGEVKAMEMDQVEVASTISSESDPKPVPTPAARKRSPPPPEPKPKSSTPPTVSAPIRDNVSMISLAQEKASTLALLGGLFSGDEWGGRESISGDEVDLQNGEGEVDYGVVPKEQRAESTVAAEMDVEGEDVEVKQAVVMTEEVDRVSESPEEEDEEEEEAAPPAPETQQYTALKDMFKPQEESGGFSLGLDFELDPDAESFLPASIQRQPVPEPVTVPITVQTPSQKHAIQYTPDPREIMFFPGTGPKDVFSVIAEKGWRWEHPGTSEEIRAKWDKNKLELTREYTRRHREAAKKQRRGGGIRKEEA